MGNLNYQLPNNLGELMRLEEKIKAIWMSGFNGELDRLVKGYLEEINEKISMLVEIEPNPNNAL